MKSVKFSGANTVFKAPEGWEEERNGPCEDLHVEVKGPVHRSIWYPSEEERVMIAEGGGIVLDVVGGQPPISLQTCELSFEEPSEVTSVTPSTDEVVDLPTNHGGVPIEEGHIYATYEELDADDDATPPSRLN